MRNRVLALALCLSVTPALAESSPAPAGEIRGRAVGPDRSTGVAGATVSIGGGARVTAAGANGAFFLSGVPAGHQVVTCAAQGFKPGRVEVDVTAGGIHQVTCALGALAAKAESKADVAKRRPASEPAVDALMGTLSAEATGSVGLGTLGKVGVGQGGGGAGYGRVHGMGSVTVSGYGSAAGSTGFHGEMRAPAPRVVAGPVTVAGRPLAVMPGAPGSAAVMTGGEDLSREGYDGPAESDFVAVTQAPLSTFSIDVDTASYSNIRRFVEGGNRPPRDAVRIEEMVNSFRYDYPEPAPGEPFSVNMEASEAPWRPEHRLVRIGLQAPHIAASQLPPTHLTFLIDVSGSMNHPAKLPLLKQSFRLLIDALRPQDTVALVVYAGAAGVVLPPTEGSQKGQIVEALENLQAGGSTAGAAGIRLAYQVARSTFVRGTNNRVILATDGDFNVGTSSDGELVELIEQERKSGVFLTLLGFGMGNYQDAKMQKLADAGNGHHAYIDSLAEARKTLVAEMGATLLTVAKDVKLQVEFNPSRVKAYRLIGYDNRRLADADFDNDAKDAGELGAGHSVTALYEIVPAGSEEAVNSAGPLKYQTVAPTPAAGGDELLTVKLRYKAPDADASRLLTRAFIDTHAPLAQASDDFRFATAVTELGLLLRDSPHKGGATFAAAVARAQGALGRDVGGLRTGFVTLARNAAALYGATARR